MEKDRATICNIISEMLNNANKYGIYPTTNAYEALEKYIEGVRVEAIGWAQADACTTLDRGQDYRHVNVPSILERAMVDLA